MADGEPSTSPEGFFAHSERVVATNPPVNLIIDQYSPLSHKSVIAGMYGTGVAVWTGPSWVPMDDRRRLDAYRIRAAYLLNVARHFLTASFGEQAERREYGDAAVLRDRVVAGILGDDVQIVVDGAAPDLPDAPDIAEKPDPPQSDADPIEQRVYDARLARWEAESNAAIDDWSATLDAQPRLAAWEAWWRTWWDLEQVSAKAVETEGDAVGLADGVYMLAWSTVRKRPVVTSIDPGFYFPVLTDGTDEYPCKVHLAWEHQTFEGGTRRKWVRRLTFELVPLDVPRRFPYSDSVSTVECLFSDATWPADVTRNGGLINLDQTAAVYALNEDGVVADRLPLGIDFIPLVHIPNTPATRTHFGTSVLDIVAQVLDDISASDTDLQAAAALAALPMISLAGGEMGDVVVEAGSVASIPVDGRMDVLDLSTALPELRSLNADLLDRLSVNAKVPGEILGRSSGAADQLSGISRLVKLGPFRQLISTLRLTRGSKYALLLKMAARLAVVHGADGVPDGPVPAARLLFGSYLPADVQAVVSMVVELVNAGAVSKRTGLRMLVEAGLDIGDAEDELARIAAEDTRGAVDVANATGSEQLAADHLGLELPDSAVSAQRVPVAPVISIPPAGGVPGQTGV
jgi:hypothetical protein